MSSSEANVFTEIFNGPTITWILSFLAIILVVYFCGALFSSNSPDKPMRISRLFDIMVFGVLFVYIFITSMNSSSDNQDQKSSDYYTQFLDFLNNHYSIYNIIFFIIIFYLSIYIVDIPMTAGIKPFSIIFIENIAWILFLILLIYDFFKLVLKVNLTSLLPTSITTAPTASVSSADNKTIKKKDSSGNNKAVLDQVFNISNNIYTYKEAKDVCKAFDSQLATYDQIEAAYNDGGEWCAYGWSENQMAFFPTQKLTWDKLQKTEKMKNVCGRPGVNGGYMANPNIKFGVNCYGKKPDPTQLELDMMQNSLPDMMQNSLPSTTEHSQLDSKVQFWKDNRDKLLHVNSFNHNKWSEY
jgi:hypothetical protein